MFCKTCLRSLPLSAFYVSNKSRCMECIKASVRQNRLANIDRFREFDRMRASRPDRIAARKAYRATEAFRLSHAVSTQKWVVAHVLRKKANTVVGNALRDGRIDRQPCFICGCKAEAHHPDYSSPLAVSWLCDEHHKQLHKEHRERMREAA